MLMKHETSKATENMKKQYNKRNEQFTPYKNYSSHPASENIHTKYENNLYFKPSNNRKKMFTDTTYGCTTKDKQIT